MLAATDGAGLERTLSRQGNLAWGVIGGVSSAGGDGRAAAGAVQGVWGGWGGLWTPHRDGSATASSDRGGATPHHTPHQQAGPGVTGHGAGDGTGPQPAHQAPRTGANGDGDGIVTATTQHTTDT